MISKVPIIIKKTVSLWMAAALSIAAVIQAQKGVETIENAANDPSASIMSFQVTVFHSPNLYNSPEDSSLLQFRAAIPFSLGQTNHIARLTLPYVTDSATSQSGLSV